MTKSAVISPYLIRSSAIAVSLLTFVFAFGRSDAGELHDAVRNGSASDVEALLEQGVAVDVSDFLLGTALHVAVVQGEIELATILITHGADFEAASEQQGARAMHLAAGLGDAPMLRLLLGHGAEIDSRDDHDRTPLLHAATSGSVACVELLLSEGADIEARDSRYGWTPLIGAALAGQMEVAKVLVEAGANLEARDAAGRTVLREAATPISWSAVGDGSLIEYLVARGADVNAREDNGLTILGWVETRAEEDVAYAAIAELLRSLGASD